MTHLISNFLSNHLKNIECVFQMSWIIKAKGKAHRKFFKYAEVFEKSIFCDTMFASLNCSYFGTHLSHMQMEIIFLHYLMGILIINSLHVMQNFCNTWLPKKVRWKAGSIFFHITFPSGCTWILYLYDSFPQQWYERTSFRPIPSLLHSFFHFYFMHWFSWKFSWADHSLYTLIIT